MEKRECQTLKEDIDVTDVSETPGNEDYHREIIASTKVHQVKISC